MTAAALILLALAAPLIASLAVAGVAMATERRDLAKQILIAWDQLGNVFVWARGEGFGKADETLSARAWRLRHRIRTWGVFQLALDRVCARLGDPDHCLGSYVAEFERHQLPPAYRTSSPAK